MWKHILSIPHIIVLRHDIVVNLYDVYSHASVFTLNYNFPAIEKCADSRIPLVMLYIEAK